MKIFYSESPNSRKVCAVAKHLKTPVTWTFIDLQKGEHNAPGYLTINPNGKVPALQDGAFTLFESNAIMIYLAQQAGSDLWPLDPGEQVEVIKWLSWDTAHFSRHGGTLFFQNLLKPKFGVGDPDQAAVEEATRFFLKFAAVLDKHLASRSFLVGDRLTVADIAVATMLPLAEPSNIPIGGFEAINRWHDGLMALPAWVDPYPTKPASAAA